MSEKRPDNYTLKAEFHGVNDLTGVVMVLNDLGVLYGHAEVSYIHMDEDSMRIELEWDSEGE